MRISVNAGALQMVLNILKRGTAVQQEAAAELEATVNTDEFAWHKREVVPTHSGLYWARFITEESSEPVEGPLHMEVVLVRGLRLVQVPRPWEVDTELNWNNMKEYHRIPHQMYEEPEDVDLSSGQANLDWS